MSDQNHDDLQEKIKKAQQEADNQETELDATQQLKEELEKMTETAKRTMADLQNLRRRHEEERIALLKAGNANLISTLLPAIDNLN